MTTTILIEVPDSMLDVAKKLEVPLAKGQIGEQLGLGKIESLHLFGGDIWDIAYNLSGPHPLPTLDGKLIVASTPLQKCAPWREPDDNDKFSVTLEDGTQETIRWDDPRLEDEDEVLPYFDDRFDEFEE